MRTLLPLAAAALHLLAAAPAARAGDGEGDDPTKEPAGAAERLRASTADLDDLRTEVGGWTIRFGGRFALDGVKYDRRNRRRSGAFLSDARPVVEASRGEVRLRLEADLLGADAPRNLREAWASWEPDPALRLTAGQFRVALGSEYATPEGDLPFPGYAFPSELDGRHDAGLRLSGRVAEERIWYEATATAGHGFGLDGRRRQGGQRSLRLAVHPFAPAEPGDRATRQVLGGWFVGAGLADLAGFDDPVVLRTPLRSTVFTTPDLDGRSGRWVHLETGFAAGPVAVGLERVEGSADSVPAPGGRTDVNQLSAWSAHASWNLTGQGKRWREGRWALAEDPEPWRDRWELGVRYSNGDIDRDLFGLGFTTYDPSTQEVRTLTVSVGWSPAPNTRVLLAWVKTIADDGLTTFGGRGPTIVPRVGEGNRDSSYLLRLEVDF